MVFVCVDTRALEGLNKSHCITLLIDKEVLGYYEAGLQIPDDVTLLWTDDKYVLHLTLRCGDGSWILVKLWQCCTLSSVQRAQQNGWCWSLLSRMSALVCVTAVTDQIVDSMTTSVVYVYALVDDLTPSLGR